jgi:hypothetical protein
MVILKWSFKKLDCIMYTLGIEIVEDILCKVEEMMMMVVVIIQFLYLRACQQLTVYNRQALNIQRRTNSNTKTKYYKF